MLLNDGAGGETRTHGGFPPDYKSGAIATMRLQHVWLREDGIAPPTFGLWDRRATTAPLRNLFIKNTLL